MIGSDTPDLASGLKIKQDIEMLPGLRYSRKNFKSPKLSIEFEKVDKTETKNSNNVV